MIMVTTDNARALAQAGATVRRRQFIHNTTFDSTLRKRTAQDVQNAKRKLHRVAMKLADELIDGGHHE